MTSFLLKSDEINEIMGAKMAVIFSSVLLFCIAVMENWNLLKK